MPSPRGLRLLAFFLLVAWTCVAFAPVLANDFVYYDDSNYITENPVVQAGLTADGARWAFGYHQANWHPLTWLSHMLDVQLFGLDPRGHHAVNVLLHALSACLLFAALRRLTACTWTPWAIALVFAIHPLRVESVAWAAERKDVLALLFGNAALWAYALHAARPSALRLALVALFLALGLSAKPMLVTLPFVFLLLDFWPLKRLPASGTGPWLEKLPLFALAAASCFLTFRAQSTGGAVGSLDTLGATARLGNACEAYLLYVVQFFWPTRLAFLYPHPALIDPTGYAAWNALALTGAGFLAATTVVAVALRRRLSFLPVGWFWYAGTLVPVVGLVQVGLQKHADRYTYLPLIGLTLALFFGLRQLVIARSSLRVPVVAIFLLACVGLTLRTRDQVTTWRDPETLFRHALLVTDDNYVAHTYFGRVLARAGDLDEARTHLEAAVAIRPDEDEALANLAAVDLAQGRLDEARARFEQLVARRPDFPALHYNLGVVALRQKRLDDARAHLERALTLSPTDAAALHDLGVVFERQDKPRKAMRSYRQALTADPTLAPSANNLAWLLATAASPTRAEAREALALAQACARATDHADPATLDTLAAACASAGDFPAAVRWQQRAMDLSTPQAALARQARLRVYQSDQRFVRPNAPAKQAD